MGGRIWREKRVRDGGGGLVVVTKGTFFPLPYILCPTSSWPSPEQRALFRDKAETWLMALLF